MALMGKNNDREEWKKGLEPGGGETGGQSRNLVQWNVSGIYEDNYSKI